MRAEAILIVGLFLVQLSSSSSLVKPDSDQVSKELADLNRNQTDSSKSLEEEKVGVEVESTASKKDDARSFTSEVLDAVEKLKCTFVTCEKKEGEKAKPEEVAKGSSEPTTTTSTTTTTTTTQSPSTTSTDAPK